MAVARITAWMIQGNDVMFIDTPERSECWICHEPGVPHALMLSCPHEDRPKMEQFVAELKAKTEPV